MKKIILFLSIALLIIQNLHSQKMITFDYNELNHEEMLAAHVDYIRKKSYEFLYNDYNEDIISKGIKFVKRHINTDEKDENETREMSKLEKYKKQYSSFSIYPQTILDGWHFAVISDNTRFCKQVKVLVESNKIKKLVVDNYLPINVQAFTKIKNAKSLVNLENFGGEELVPVDVYMLFDIEESNVVEEPLKPGVVCFYTSVKKHYNEIQIVFDKKKLERLTKIYENILPVCDEIGTVCLLLKAGKYHFTGYGRGSKSWESQFKVESCRCLKIGIHNK
jgi:hypothetical protein